MPTAAAHLLVGSTPFPGFISSLPFPAPARPALRGLFLFLMGGLGPKEPPHQALLSICQRICVALAGASRTHCGAWTSCWCPSAPHRDAAASSSSRN